MVSFVTETTAAIPTGLKQAEGRLGASAGPVELAFAKAFVKVTPHEASETETSRVSVTGSP